MPDQHPDLHTDHEELELVEFETHTEPPHLCWCHSEHLEDLWKVFGKLEASDIDLIRTALDNWHSQLVDQSGADDYTDEMIDKLEGLNYRFHFISGSDIDTFGDRDA